MKTKSRIVYLISIVSIFMLSKFNSVQAANVDGQEKLSLNGDWKFSVDTIFRHNTKWNQSAFNAKGWDDLNVPGNWDTENKYANFVGTGFYRKNIFIPADWKGSTTRLCFGAVYQTAEVWLNGEYLGKHVGGYTPFEFDVSEIIKPGKINTIALSANNNYRRGAWWHWGGISRPVYLSKDSPQRIVRQHIVAEPNLKLANAVVTTNVTVKNNSDKDFHGVLSSTIFNKNDKICGKKIKKEIFIEPHTEIKVTMAINLDAEETMLWDLQNPYLYRLSSVISSEKTNVIDKVDDRFGIRKVEVVGARLLLNGKVQYLNGFNRIADHRAYGQTEPEYLVKFDIDAMKAMGCNFTRIMHYPQAKSILDYCDEVGVLLFTEIPVWGKGDPQLEPDNRLTKQWLTEMITRDFNHPSIIGWSVANEIADEKLDGQKMSPKIYQYVATMLDHVATLDSTRLKTYVSYTANNASELGVDPADICDVVCSNCYGNAYTDAIKMHKLWPEKPIFFSEIGTGQVGEDLKESGLNQSLIKTIKQLETLDYVIGSSLWSYNDYRSTYGGTPLSQNRAWGAYNVWRQPKKAAYEIRELYTKRLSDQPLPSLVEIPEKTPEGDVYIEAVISMKKSCMVGFSVLNKTDNYEIEYRKEGEEPKIIKIKGLRGAAKVYDLNTGVSFFLIRRISVDGIGHWSAPYSAAIL
jgi:beta-galactosidase